MEQDLHTPTHDTTQDANNATSHASAKKRPHEIWANPRSLSQNPIEPSFTRYSFLALPTSFVNGNPVAALRSEARQERQSSASICDRPQHQPWQQETAFSEPELKAVAATFATDADLRAPDGGLIKGRAALEKLYVALFAARFEDARVTVASPADNRYRGANVAATRPSTARGGRKKTPLRLRRGDSCKMVWVVASPRTVVRVR